MLTGSAPPETRWPAPSGPADLFSQDQLESHAARIAGTHVVAADPWRGRPLLPRLDESASRLDEAYTFLSAAARLDPQPSEDWLRDNHHVVQDQVRGVRLHLPGAYYRELPKLADGPLQGFPRVYLLARELTAHTAGRIDLDTVVDFVRAYQRTSVLSIGETWAVPIMLRLALVEQLRLLADGVLAARQNRDSARRWHAPLAADKALSARRIEQVLQDGTTTDGRLSAAFVVELLQWLRDQPLTAAPLWTALHETLESQGESIDEMLRLEHQREAADQLAIGNVITSMRLLSSIDWTKFFERVSIVERVLREDPGGAYAQMDFQTRDRYRNAVEQVAKRTRLTEPDVAARAIALARAARDEGGDDRPHHVGYYLISRGRFNLERETGYRPTLRERMARFAFDHQALGYLGTLSAATSVGVASLLVYAARHGASTAELWLVAIVVLLPVSELAINLLNLIVTSQVPPRPLPKLGMLEGLPPHSRTMVVVPVLVDSHPRLQTLLDDLEVRFLGNRDLRLHFALLADFADAEEPSRDGDAGLLEAARRAVDELNERHGHDRFYYFHRERRWNPSEGRWMGWERKRGKLTEFNRLLRGANDTSFIVCHGDLTLLTSVKYVITLDSDTQLPMEAGRRLVGTLSHPLNRPRFDPARGRVTQGYGVLQPRVGVDLVSANRTLFARVFSGHVGVDPYTTAVSDVYQDLFHEGSYVGKGIYDVDAFDAALADRVPENALLSHDLFEGFYARAGLCTDSHLVDDYPADYLAFAARQHRWVRGDWQIVRWLWPTVPNASRQPVRNTLGAIARWKILDNLRRSLLAPSLMALLVLGWTMLPGSAVLWTGLTVLVLAFPAYTQVARSLGSRVRGVPWSQHVAAERDNVLTSARQALFWSTFLAHQSWLMLDAIVRTLWRLLVTRRHLLEWVSADRSAGVTLTARVVTRRMWMAPATGVVVAALVAIVAPAHLPLALPVSALWILSPAVALVFGRPTAHTRQLPGPADRLALRAVARRTWRYFEDLLTPADHWLIPDNIQDDRKEAVAHRTSPTNVGLQVLSTISAYHFGYLSFSAVIDRLEPTFATLAELPRYRGHFYNWYDTQTLAPLLPKYVSTVDSGNLAGYLLTLNGAIRSAIQEAPIADVRALHGVEDAVCLFEACLASSASRGTAARAIKKEIADLRTLFEVAPDSLAAWRTHLVQIGDRVATLGLLLHESEETAADTADDAWVTEAHQWLERASMGVAQRLADLSALAPWTTLAQLMAEGFRPPPATTGLGPYAAWCREASVSLVEQPGADALRLAFERASSHAQALIDRALSLAEQADELASEMDFTFLFDRQRQLFSIGLSVTDGRLDSSYYDTLASEARLASFIAIATGQISHDHWFKLGRSLTHSGSARALLSWSASMFEYLMPLLVMRVYPGTLLDETYRAVVQRQQQYAAQRSVPWGISESAFNAVDMAGNYQYRAFGVPGLGLKTGLADDLVVAPYASILAAPLAPLDVLANLRHFEREGALGRYGFVEAIDYTPERRTESETLGVVLRTYMAHHQGMSLVSLDNALHDAPMQRYFHADPRIQAADLLLQERIPHVVPLSNPPIELAEHVPSARVTAGGPVLRHATPHTLSPRAYLLSNGSYTVMVTNAGGGYSRRQQIAMTRWREDVTTDAWGSFCYLRDLDTGVVWSSAYQPTAREPDEYEVIFAPDRAIFRRVDEGIEVRTEIVVSPEDDAELRRVVVTNLSTRHRTIELTSYAEVVLAPHDSDLAHPAFSNLFVETSAVPALSALICTRRPRSGRDRQYLVHVLSGHGRSGADVQYETDRARFIGRAGSLARPRALAREARLSNTTGPVLDPIVSLRQSARVPPGATARFTFTTAYADSDASARYLIEKYHDRRAVARAFALAGTHSQVELRHLNLSLEDTTRFQRIGGRLITGDARLRSIEAIEANTRGQRDLWKYGISGDIPILLARVADGSHLPLVADLLKTHEYLRLRGLPFDLVILNEHPASYLQALQEEVQRLVERSPESQWIDRPGGVFLRRADLMPAEDQLLVRAAARVMMDGANGGLKQQLSRASVPITPEPTRTRVSEAVEPTAPVEASPLPAPDLEHFNGFGGFADSGREFVIPVHPAAGSLPPSPWSNVVAHSRFGFACTETGPGYTWSGNSHDNRLTPWRNDPVSDPPGEAVFIRDEETGAFWSATPLPAGGGQPYTVRHGQGYSIYEHLRGELRSDLVLFVPCDETVKVFRLALHNTSSRRRRLSVTLYVDWVVGENRSRTSIHVVTGTEAHTGAVLARNVFRQEFPERVAFLDLWPRHRGRTLTGDRTEFIGRNGSLERPAALGRRSLSGRTGAALDPCGAIHVELELAPGASEVLTGLLGDASDAAEACNIVSRFRGEGRVDAALVEVRRFWDSLLGTIVVRTPDPSMDVVLNRWLLYQTLACRIWGRSAFYQSSGAFGFRDQLQDTLALLLSAPHLVRAHLLHAASRQFVEGDVQHWWHEPGGQGVRTRFSDDRLWLVYGTLQYIDAIGDDAVLDEQVPFLAGRVLNPDEHEAYEHPTVSAEIGSLYEHCRRAIAVSLPTGAHGLPLMGTGDWNDGMSLVGAAGRGESVWLASFMVSILPSFADIAAARGDGVDAAMYREHSDALTAAIEAAWDGAWYRRAYFDDGTPLGSKENPEGQIDAIAQSWAVLAGTLDPARTRQAMASVDERLIRRDDRLALLLWPPFDRMEPDPGYIRGYLPGVRENGGQYTHAALWNVLAFATLGDGDRAGELFSLLNPVNYSRTPQQVARYRAEPYVVAADVYSVPPHTGRGGWTWYTGSAGWMYRVGVEAILGVRLRRGALQIDPCIPRSWPGYEVIFKPSDTPYRIVVENPSGVSRGVTRLELDGVDITGQDVPLVDDGAAHKIRVVLG
ncbi:glucoamylase family protein [soil metagenome]